VVAIIDDSQLQEDVSIGRSRTDQRPTSADSVEIMKEGDAKLDIELITIFTCHPINFGNVSVIYWKRFSDIKVTIFFFDT